MKRIIAVAVAAVFLSGCISRRTDSTGRGWIDFNVGTVTNGHWGQSK